MPFPIHDRPWIHELDLSVLYEIFAPNADSDDIADFLNHKEPYAFKQYAKHQKEAYFIHHTWAGDPIFQTDDRKSKKRTRKLLRIHQRMMERFRENRTRASGLDLMVSRFIQETHLMQLLSIRL